MEQQTAAPEAGAPSDLASQVGVERLFAPESVAVVGASEQGLGHMVFANLLLWMAALPIKMVLRWTVNLKYLVGIPEWFFNI